MTFREARTEKDAALERVLAWADDQNPPVAVRFGTGSKNPGARFAVGDRPVFSMCRGFTRPYIEIPFAKLRRTPGFADQARRRELQNRLNDIPAVDITDEQLEKYPSFPLDAIASEQAWVVFESTCEWILAELVGFEGSSGKEQ